MKNKNHLGLLDDSENGFGTDEREWMNLTQAPLEAAAKAIKDAQAVQTASQKLRAAAAKAPSPNQKLMQTGAKLFRNRPSLRQLMQEYNGRSSSLPPLKSTISKPVSTSPIGRPSDFRWDSIEIMDVPISGRILRPS